MKRKRGLSNILAMVLFVILALVAVTLVWNFIIPLLYGQGEVVEAERKLFLEEIEIKNVDIYTASNTVKLVIQRGTTQQQFIGTTGEEGQGLGFEADFFSVVDLSGSMDGEPLVSAQDANEQFVNEILQEGDHKIGLVGYRDTDESAEENFHALTNDADSLKLDIDAWTAGGNTCICCGINRAIEGFFELGRGIQLAPCTSNSECDDGNECTINTCDNGECRSSNGVDGISCENGFFCDGAEICQAGSCVSSGNPCPDDGFRCTKECSEQQDACITNYRHQRCSDISANDCLINARCDPSDPEADSVWGCVYDFASDGTSCSDSISCTINDLCDGAGNCLSGTPDQDSCTSLDSECSAGMCDPIQGCVGNPINEGNSCDDNNACTSSTTCSSGVCSDGSSITQCTNGDGCCPSTCDENNDNDCSAELVLHLKFDDDLNDNQATDSSTYNHHGTCTNCPVYDTNDKRQGTGSYVFDGNSYLELGNWDVTGDEMTISLWFRADDLDPFDVRLISKASSTSEQAHYWMISAIGGPLLRFRLKTGSNPNSGTTTLIADSGNLELNTWTHAVATYDGAEMKLYKDGVKVGSVAKTGTLATNSDIPVWIGRNPDGYGPWDGVIDEVRMYSRALTEQEISDIYSLSIGCGNGFIDLGEDCDDGNQEDNDGCSSSCEIEEKVRVMIVMSDGNATVTCEKQGNIAPAQAAIEAANDAREEGIEIYSVGFGESVDGATLEAIAGSADRYYSSEIGNLVAIYTEIANTIKRQYETVESFNQLKVVFISETETGVITINDPPTNAFEAKTYTFDLPIENVIRIEIYPVVITSSGREIVSSKPSDVFEVGP